MQNSLEDVVQYEHNQPKVSIAQIAWLFVAFDQWSPQAIQIFVSLNIISCNIIHVAFKKQVHDLM